MLMVGFQSPGIILWSRHSIGGLSCLGEGLRSLSALVVLINMFLVPLIISSSFRVDLPVAIELSEKFT